MPPLNLIPLLCLRPLRLVLSSEDHRRIRILLLKATHVPFVALIWVYERFRRLVARRVQPRLAKMPHLSSRPRSASQASVQRDRSTMRSPTHSRAANDSTPMASRRITDTMDNSASSTADTDLVSLVQKLSAQVDSLTAMVAGQQKD